MSDFIKVELTQEQYERLKNEYDLRVEFKKRHFIQEFEYRSMSGEFFRYVGPNARLKEIARLKNNEQHHKSQVEGLISQVKSFQAALEKSKPWWKKL